MKRSREAATFRPIPDEVDGGCWGCDFHRRLPEDEDDDAEPEDDEDPKADRRGARRRAANGAKANGRDGIGNFGSNLTVTGKYSHSYHRLLRMLTPGK